MLPFSENERILVEQGGAGAGGGCSIMPEERNTLEERRRRFVMRYHTHPVLATRFIAALPDTT